MATRRSADYSYYHHAPNHDMPLVLSIDGGTVSPLPSTLIAAARSGEVRGSYLAVFVELHEWLDADEFRPVKPWSVGERLNIDAKRVYRALETLMRLGYLEQGARHGNARTFRLAQRA